MAPGGARHQHAHTREQRADEDDDDEEDLPAHANRGVAGEADEVADQRMIDNALKAADGILQNGRPGDLPHRRRDRSVDDRTIEVSDVLAVAGAWRLD